MINKAILVGRLTADPELKKTPNGVSVCSFTIAVNRNGKDAGTDFIDCVAWRGSAEFICNYFSKGESVGIVGTVQTRTFETSEGKKRKVTEVLCEHLSFVEKKKDSTPTNNPPYPAQFSDMDGFAPADDLGDLPF